MSTARRIYHNLLKALRCAPLRSFLQKDVAFWIDLDPADLGRIERGEREPSLRTALRLSALYGKSVNEVFFEGFEEACDFVGGRQRLREVPRPTQMSARPATLQGQDPLLPRSSRDILMLVSAARLNLFAVDGQARPRPLLQVPDTVGSDEETLAHLLGTVLRTRGPARLLVSVHAETPYEERVVPVVDALATLRKEQDLDVLWLPDLYALASVLHPEPTGPKPATTRAALSSSS